MILPLFAAAAASTLQPGSALEKDVRCIAAIAIAGDMAEKDDDKNAMMSLMFYYLGKVDARAPDLDLENAIVSVTDAKDYETAGMPADMLRCAGEIEQRGKELEAIGSALEKRGK